jgi:hypothetical protein
VIISLIASLRLKKQQVIALGKLGWPLRRIEKATSVRRETAGAYLKAAGVVVCLPGWGRRAPTKPAIQVPPDSEAKPAIGVTPDFIASFSEKQSAPSDPSPPSASVCEVYRELIEQGFARGRNGKAIWQDLVSDHGFAGGYQAVKRFVRTLRGPQRPEAAGIILTAAGETPAPPLPTSACMNIASCAVIWSAAHTRKCFCARSIP